MSPSLTLRTSTFRVLTTRIRAGLIASRQMVYQTSLTNPNRFAGLSGIRGDYQPLAGGWVMDNPRWVYPHRGYKADSIWTYRLQTASGYQVAIDSMTDLNSMLVFDKAATLTPKAVGSFVIYVIFTCAT